MDYSNIPLGLRITTQIPLDVKTYIQNEAALINLGTNNNLAYTYVKGSTFYCIDEGTRYEWREVIGAEQGLRPTNFTYSNNVLAFGVIYSNKIYNFFKIEVVPQVKSDWNSVSGYSEILNKPTIPSAQVNSDWNSISGISQILNKPTIYVPPFEKIDEGNGFGYIIRGRDATFYGSIGLDAFDISYSDTVSSVFGATGESSFAQGYQVKASGYGTVGFGSDLDINGVQDFVTGINNTTAGFTNYVTGVGHSITSMGTTVIGQASNIYSQQIADYNITDTKPLFIIGNGTIADDTDVPTYEPYDVMSRSDAFIVRMNGVATLPSVTNALISAEATGKAVVTKEYLTSQIGSSVQSVTITHTPSALDTGYNISTGILAGKTIISVIPFFECISATGGYLIGDIVTGQTPSADDSGGLADSGIGVTFTSADPTEIVYSINNGFDINAAYTGSVGTSGVIGNPIRYTDFTNWNVRLVILYI